MPGCKVVDSAVSRASVVPQASSSVHLLLVEVGEYRLAISADHVSEILSYATLSCPVAAPSVLAGFLNLGRTLIPILRVTRLIDAQETPIGLHTPIILLKDAESRIGLLVSRVLQLNRTSRSALTPIAGHPIADHAANLDGQVVPVVSLAHLLLQQERRRIAELQQAEAHRLQELVESNT